MTSFAKSVSESSIKTDSPRQAFETARDGRDAEAEARPSSMVERDKPHPVPRPSPDMAMDSDRAAFNAAWAREQRRAAFIKERTDPKTGGRVRVLNKRFNR